MVEGLECYIKATILEGSLLGLPLHNLQPAPSHNQFADDTLLMKTPMAHEAKNINSILSDFVKTSGMSLNLDKSRFYFFNTSIVFQNHVSHLLGMPKSSLPSNYLGLPLMGEPTHSISWDSLLLSISYKLTDWTFIPLNIVARLVLLKVVLQALLTYLFTTLTAPKSVIREIKGLQQKFLWHGHIPNKKWALVRWEKLRKPKNLGNLGLPDLGKLNQVMGAKMWWRWLKHPTKLWAQLWKHKYAPTTRFDQLIQFNDQIHGSNIWNTTW
jgi:hypothetical protein